MPKNLLFPCVIFEDSQGFKVYRILKYFPEKVRHDEVLLYHGALVAFIFKAAANGEVFVTFLVPKVRCKR